MACGDATAHLPESAAVLPSLRSSRAPGQWPPVGGPPPPPPPPWWPPPPPPPPPPPWCWGGGVGETIPLPIENRGLPGGTGTKLRGGLASAACRKESIQVLP